MPRAFHSASSIALGARCRHAWALRYIAGIRDPEITWDDVIAGKPYTNRQRSTALGKAVHAVNEAWQRGDPVDWRGLPGEIALSGAHLIPHPSEALDVHVETGIGLVPLPPREGNEGPDTALNVHGVLWVGYRDLLTLPSAAAAKRLGVLPHWLLVDYKTTASIERYALTPAELARDVQANLYAIDVCDGFALDAIQARWVYYESKRVRRAEARDVIIRRDDALAVLEPAAVLARELDAIPDVASAPKNPLACGDYGGCPHHVSVGGPCDARRSIGALIQARVKKQVNTMALSPEVQARFDAMKAARNGAATHVTVLPDQPAPAATATQAGTQTVVAPNVAVMLPDQPAPTPPPRAPRSPRKPRTPAAAEAVAPVEAAAPAPSGVAGVVLALQAELAAAQAEVETATAKRDSVLAMIREALAA